METRKIRQGMILALAIALWAVLQLTPQDTAVASETSLSTRPIPALVADGAAG